MTLTSNPSDSSQRPKNSAPEAEPSSAGSPPVLFTPTTTALRLFGIAFTRYRHHFGHSRSVSASASGVSILGDRIAAVTTRMHREVKSATKSARRLGPTLARGG